MYISKNCIIQNLLDFFIDNTFIVLLHYSSGSGFSSSFFSL